MFPLVRLSLYKEQFRGSFKSLSYSLPFARGGQGRVKGKLSEIVLRNSYDETLQQNVRTREKAIASQKYAASWKDDLVKT